MIVYAIGYHSGYGVGIDRCYTNEKQAKKFVDKMNKQDNTYCYYYKKIKVYEEDADETKRLEEEQRLLEEQQSEPVPLEPVETEPVDTGA